MAYWQVFHNWGAHNLRGGGGGGNNGEDQKLSTFWNKKGWINVDNKYVHQFSTRQVYNLLGVMGGGGGAENKK